MAGRCLIARYLESVSIVNVRLLPQLPDVSSTERMKIYQEMSVWWLRVLWLTIAIAVTPGFAQNQRPANFDYTVNVDITPTPKYFFNSDSPSPSPFVNPTTPVFHPTGLAPQEEFDDRSFGGPQFRPQFRQRPAFHPGGRALIDPTTVPYTDNYLGNVGYGPNYFGYDELRQCFPIRQCRPSRYRTIDGSCNNLQNPQWGAAGTPYGRLVPPRFADNVHAPPRSVTGQPLPEARLLSRIFLPPGRRDDDIWTLATMQWGQIVTHDMSLGMATLPNPNAPECCSPQNGPLFRKLSKGEPCYPPILSKDDPLFLKYRQTCFEFIRTTTDHQNGCPTSKYAKPLSEVTHWLDGSTVYGSDERTLRQLRTNRGGQLRVEVRDGQEWPPTELNSTIACARPSPEQVCYKTGDVRVNQNPQLALLQIVLMREHNRLAEILVRLNPHWEDDRIFQEARRILIAEIQHITYYEWLPIFLGKSSVLDSGLMYESSGAYVNDYEERINPSVLSEHAQSAFRFLHTNIQGNILLMSEDRFSQGHIRLSENMQDVSILEAGAFEDLTRGLTTQFQHATDRYHTSEITENLFRRPENPMFGFDLKTLDIQRGRDHGLGSYNDYREHCGFRRAQTFSQFTDLIATEDVERLANVYLDPNDVDLTVGGALEGSGPEGPPGLGPTFTCIIKEQFLRTRVGDRYFFERGNQPGAFTAEQLTEIRKSNLARLLCDNARVSTMQARAFEKISKQNTLVPCEDFIAIPSPHLGAWRETRRGKFVTQYESDYKK